MTEVLCLHILLFSMRLLYRRKDCHCQRTGLFHLGNDDGKHRMSYHSGLPVSRLLRTA